MIHILMVFSVYIIIQIIFLAPLVGLVVDRFGYSTLICTFAGVSTVLESTSLLPRFLRMLWSVLMKPSCSS